MIVQRGLDLFCAAATRKSICLVLPHEGLLSSSADHNSRDELRGVGIDGIGAGNFRAIVAVSRTHVVGNDQSAVVDDCSRYLLSPHPKATPAEVSYTTDLESCSKRCRRADLIGSAYVSDYC
jgi:hypothetical protein